MTQYYENSFYLGGAMTIFGSLIMIPAKFMLMQKNAQMPHPTEMKETEEETDMKPIFSVPKQFPHISVRVDNRPEIIDVHGYAGVASGNNK